MHFKLEAYWNSRITASYQLTFWYYYSFLPHIPTGYFKSFLSTCLLSELKPHFVSKFKYNFVSSIKCQIQVRNQVLTFRTQLALLCIISNRTDSNGAAGEARLSIWTDATLKLAKTRRLWPRPKQSVISAATADLIITTWFSDSYCFVTIVTASCLAGRCTCRSLLLAASHSPKELLYVELLW